MNILVAWLRIDDKQVISLQVKGGNSSRVITWIMHFPTTDPTAFSRFSFDSHDWGGTRGIWPIARNSNRSLWYHHTRMKLFGRSLCLNGQGICPSGDGFITLTRWGPFINYVRMIMQFLTPLPHSYVIFHFIFQHNKMLLEKDQLH